MVKSASSSRWALRKYAVKLPNGDWALTDEIAKCVWLDETILKSEAGRCSLTGVIVSKTYLNSDGQLIALAELLDGKSGTARSDPSLIRTLQKLDSDLAGLHVVTVVQSPGKAQAACCEPASSQR